MTPLTEITNTATPVPVELAVAIGRIEEKLTSMSTNENKTGDRLEKIEQRLSNVELNFATNVRPKTPWYTVAAGVGALLAIAINGVMMLNVLNTLGSLIP